MRQAWGGNKGPVQVHLAIPYQPNPWPPALLFFFIDISPTGLAHGGLQNWAALYVTAKENGLSGLFPSFFPPKCHIWPKWLKSLFRGRGVESANILAKRTDREEQAWRCLLASGSQPHSRTSITNEESDHTSERRNPRHSK